jgi:hypothetical protein
MMILSVQREDFGCNLGCILQRMILYANKFAHYFILMLNMKAYSSSPATTLRWLYSGIKLLA